VTNGLNLGYLVFEVRQLAAWEEFCTSTLGLAVSMQNSDGSHGYRLDAACHRLIVQSGRADDLSALGFDCGDDATLDALLARFDASTVQIIPADQDLHAARQVERLYLVKDPDGNTVELFTGLRRMAQPFSASGFPGGFRTGALGIGHAVLVTHAIKRMEDFYGSLLGFGVRERLDTRLGPVDLKGTFMHCNHRHHSIGLFDMPLRKKLQHFMLQANQQSDVGRAYERVRRHKVPLSLDMGQHSDGTFSFYAATPSGFDFEIGSGCKELDTQGWEALKAAETIAWGHQPQLRLRLKMAGEILVNRFLG